MYSSSQIQYQALWQMCLTQIKEHITEDTYLALFEPLEILDYKGNILRIKVPSHNHLRKIEQNYIQYLAPIIKSNFGQEASVRYAIPTTNHSDAQNSAMIRGYSTETDKSAIKNPFVIPGIKRVKFNSQLIHKYRFDNFVEGQCNKLVRSASLAVAASPGTTSFNPLFIYGNSGLGKTHVAHAIGNEIEKRAPETKILFVSANKFQAQFQHASRNSELSEFIQFYQMVDVLIIDDIQEFSGNKPGTQNVFFNIFNHLHQLGKQLILTSDRPPVELKDIEDRLITRFKWGLSGELGIPDFATKVNILKQKSNELNIDIPCEVMEFIASHVKANIRELEGSLNSLLAHSNLMNSVIDLDLARNVMKDIVSIDTKELSINFIIDVVSNYYKIDKQDILSIKRSRPIVLARHIAMYLCKRHLKTPLAVIGKALGGKTHATVLHAEKTIQNLIDTDKMIRLDVEDIERKLKY